MFSGLFTLFRFKVWLYLLVLIAIVFTSYQYLMLRFTVLNVSDQGYVLEILPKENFKSVLTRLTNDHVLSKNNKNALYILSKINKYDRKIRAGEYLILPGISAIQLLQQLLDGKVLLHKFTIVEGLRFAQVLDALQNHPKIQQTVTDFTCKEILHSIERVTALPNIEECEGLFLPNTYLFAKNTKDTVILQEAYDAMKNKLDNLWSSSNTKGVLRSSYEVLIMASIIEKETSIIEEMNKVSGVYHKRLQTGMPLQADPTVIYGLKIFDRPLSYADLKKTSDYNTYRNRGLPPTPIAMPGIAAIAAALHPTDDDNLYFVADGSGGHVFSASLDEHNRAVSAIRSNKK